MNLKEKDIMEGTSKIKLIDPVVTCVPRIILSDKDTIIEKVNNM